MKRMNNHDRWMLLSELADDAIDPGRRTEAAELLKEDPEARDDLECIRFLKESVRMHGTIPENPDLWTRISDVIAREDGTETRHDASWRFLQPKFRPVAAGLAALMLLVLGGLIVANRDQLLDYLSHRSSDMQLVYEENLKGWLMPLLSHTDNDKVLAFAMFGSIPLDDASHSVLLVDSARRNGYRIEFGPAARARLHPVTVEDLYREVRATPSQRRSIDTLLSEAQRHIESAVLLSDDKDIAIDQQLAGLDEVILASVASSLDLHQRALMARFVAERGGALPTAVIERPSPSIIHDHMQPGSSSYVVVTGGSQAQTRRLQINSDSIRRRIEDLVIPSVPQAQQQLQAAERMRIELRRMQRAFERARTVDAPAGDVSVTREHESIVIHLPAELLDLDAPPMVPAVPAASLPGAPAPPATPPRRTTVSVRIGYDSLRGAPRNDSLHLRLRVDPGGMPGLRLNIDSVINEAMRHANEHQRRTLELLDRSEETLRQNRENQQRFPRDLRRRPDPAPQPRSMPAVPPPPAPSVDDDSLMTI